MQEIHNVLDSRRGLSGPGDYLSPGMQLLFATTLSASGSGHLDVLQWARANGCDWDTDTCSCAANVQIVEWCKEQGLTLDGDASDEVYFDEDSSDAADA